MEPKNNRSQEIIEDDIDVDELIEDEFEKHYDLQKDMDNFDDFKRLLDHKKEKGYFYPDDDDDEILIEDEFDFESEDQNEEYETKLRKAYKSYYYKVEEERSDENE